jgi:nitrogen fixation NifU-like protein
MTEQTENGNFDRVVAALLEAIREQEEALFSAVVLKEARQPRNVGIMLDPDGYALVRGPCGDTMEMYLRVHDSHVEVAAFMTDGCGPTLACGSMVTQMAQGKTLHDAAAIEAADLIIALDGLPPEHIHCATLAVNALQEAIADYEQDEEREHD